MKRKLGIILFLWLGLFSLTFAANDPVQVLQSVADQMIDGLRTHKANLKNNPEYVYSLANRVVVPHANLDAMAQKVLPPKIWNEASAAQRQKFKKEFTTLLIRTYASALEDYTDQSIKIFPVRGGIEGRDNLSVNSQIIRSDGPSIAVSYQLVNTNSQWKLVDMTVEGISMLQSFRSQFGDILNSGNMDELLRQLSAHNSGSKG